MVHDHLKSIETHTRGTSLKLIATLMGGILVLCSFIADYLFPGVQDASGNLRNAHADIIALAGAVLLGIWLVWHALTHLLAGETHMDELVAMAIIAAIALGEYQEAGVIAFFMIIASLIEQRTALGARTSIEELMELTPTSAHRVLDDGTEQEVETADLRPGDVVRVRPGQNIPTDGLVILGESTVDQANITGESVPVDKGSSDEVFGGTTNLTGALDIRVTKVGGESKLGQVQALILEAERTRIPLMRLIDRYAGWYTPTILMLAGIVLFLSRDKDVGMEKAITMLIVACPCALVLATPTAMVAALSCAARVKVFIKKVSDLEHARALTAMVFDKTGTLTTGKLTVTQMKPAPGVDGAELLQHAASAEQLSKHPVAGALQEIASRARIELIPVDPSGFEESIGRGVVARVNRDRIMVGRSQWLKERGADMRLLDDPEFREVEGLSVLYVTRNGRCIGWVGLEDKTRAEARRAIDQLREIGIGNLTMVTGDKWSVAKRVAAEMGCGQVQAECLPDQKKALVDDLRERGHRVAVVGDGVNDAGALAAGDLGIAMGAAGSDVAVKSASVVLMNNDLNLLPFVVRLSRETTKVIWQNLIYGVLFIVVMMTFAIWGPLKPVTAAILHTVASAVVIFNSARLVRFGEAERFAGMPEQAPPTETVVPAPTPMPV
ncbi:MAG: cation-translocating P-type ATPase [Phycisphaerales bacterium]|nr:MAG: cation-translocating P-type ATPase [Phycisphaerales bacterium]